MTLRRVPGLHNDSDNRMIAIVGLGVQAEAQTPCPELVRLHNAASEGLETGDESTAIGALWRALS
jgi:hypothetical protein